MSADISREPDGQETTPPNLRFLRRVVAVLTGSLVLGMIFVFGVVAVKLMSAADGVGAAPESFRSELVLAPEETVADIHVGDGILVLSVESGSGDVERLMLVRIADGSRLGEIVLRGDRQ